MSQPVVRTLLFKPQRKKKKKQEKDGHQLKEKELKEKNKHQMFIYIYVYIHIQISKIHFGGFRPNQKKTTDLFEGVEGGTRH